MVMMMVVMMNLVMIIMVMMIIMNFVSHKEGHRMKQALLMVLHPSHPVDMITISINFSFILVNL